MGHFLGCTHKAVTHEIAEEACVLAPKGKRAHGSDSNNQDSAKSTTGPARSPQKVESKRFARGIVYDMKTFFVQCVETYQELAPGSVLSAVDTPFVDEDVGVKNVSRAPCDGPGLICPQCTEAFPKESFRPTASRAEADKLCKQIRADLNEFIEANERGIAIEESTWGIEQHSCPNNNENILWC